MYRETLLRHPSPRETTLLVWHGCLSGAREMPDVARDQFTVKNSSNPRHTYPASLEDMWADAGVVLDTTFVLWKSVGRDGIMQNLRNALEAARAIG